MEITLLFDEKSNHATVNIDDHEVYYTAGNNKFFVQKIALHHSASRELILESSVQMIPIRFRITMADGLELRMKMTSAQALSYTTEKGADLYEVFQHKDRKFSIFKNEQQVAYFEKGEKARFGADRYILIADDHSDTELLLGFLLTLHLVDGSNKQAYKSTDIGNIWEKRAFDAGWKPKAR